MAYHPGLGSLDTVDARFHPLEDPMPLRRCSLVPLLLLAGFTVTAPTAANTLLLDMASDGIAVDQMVATELLGGGNRFVRWTRLATDDCFLAVDGATLQAAGYALYPDGALAPSSDIVLIRGSVRIHRPVGNDIQAGSGWEMLGAFDANGDLQIDGLDPVWNHLWLFMDDDLNGRMLVHQELHRPQTSLVQSIDLGHGPPIGDAEGNLRTNGSWVDASSTHRLMQGVVHAEIPVPVERSTWSAVKALLR